MVRQFSSESLELSNYSPTYILYIALTTYVNNHDLEIRRPICPYTNAPECHDLSFLCFLISLNMFFSSFSFWLACSQPILWVIILRWDSPSSILLSKLKPKWFLPYLLVLNGDQRAGLAPRTWFKVLAPEKPFSFLAVLWWAVDSDKWPTDEEGQALLAVGNQDTNIQGALDSNNGWLTGPRYCIVICDNIDISAGFG